MSDHASAFGPTAEQMIDFKRPVTLTVTDGLQEKIQTVQEAVQRLEGFVDPSGTGETQRGVRFLLEPDTNLFPFAKAEAAPLDTAEAERLLERADSLIPNASLRGLFGFDRFERDFYQVGEAEVKRVYVPILQVLCAGGAEQRFTSKIDFSASGDSTLNLSLSLKGVGLNYDSTREVAVSYSPAAPISGAFQLSLPALLETRRYRHRTNDDLTGIRSAIIAVDAEASLITPGEAEYADLSNIPYGQSKRFGALKTLATLGYAMTRTDALKATLSFPFFKEAGEFGLTAAVSSATGLELGFTTTKKGVFSQQVSTDGPLAHMFDATNLAQ